MSRSERYIAPSAEELERLQDLADDKERFDACRSELLRAMLGDKSKDDLVELLLQIAREEKPNEWLLEKELDLDKPIDLLIHDIESAIDIATKVDELRLTYNFHYDWRAYEVVGRGFSQLLQKHRVEKAKSLALKLIDKGSHQIECSDEGIMHEDIEECLRIVISAVAELPGSSEWACQMLRRDRSGFLCERELRELVARIDGPEESDR